VKKLSSGTKTGDLCHCGAPVWSYHMTKTYRPDEYMPATDQDSTWFWRLRCERGHLVAEIHEQPVQLSLLELP
jgi:hypothetical protein